MTFKGSGCVVQVSLYPNKLIRDDGNFRYPERPEKDHCRYEQGPDAHIGHKNSCKVKQQFT